MTIRQRNGLALGLILGVGSLTAVLSTQLKLRYDTVWLALLLIAGTLWLCRPRQPTALLYQPRGFATRWLKWMSAPQVEAAILLWMGWALLAQPEQTSLYRLTGVVVAPYALGFTFLLLGWQLAANLPTPREYVLVASSRLLYTGVVAADLWLMSGPLITLGVHLGGVLHGILALLVQWTLHEVAEELQELREDVQQVRTRMEGEEAYGAL